MRLGNTPAWIRRQQCSELTPRAELRGPCTCNENLEIEVKLYGKIIHTMPCPICSPAAAE